MNPYIHYLQLFESGQALRDALRLHYAFRRGLLKDHTVFSFNLKLA